MDCWGLWLDANVNSELLKMRRTGYGAIRSALDLSESVNRDLGNSSSAYSDKELEKALDGCDKVGYAVEDSGGVSHIGIASEGKQRLRGNILQLGEITIVLGFIA